MSKGLLHSRILSPIQALLKDGVAPEKIAWSLSFGFVLACFPVIGVTTIMCILAAFAFRLNQLAIQVANFMAIPAQILLFVPYFRLGENLFGLSPIPFDLQKYVEWHERDFRGASLAVAHSAFAAMVVWLATSPIAIVLLYKVALPHLKRLHHKLAQGSSETR